MPTLYQLKPAFQDLLRPLTARLAHAGVTANQVTIGTGIASVALGTWLTLTHRGWILLPFFLFLRMAMNAIDGMLAREYGQKSQLGALLNELSDLISDAALAFPFATLPGWNPLAVCAAIFFATLTEIPRRHDGPFGKSDRAFALGTLGVWVSLGWPVSPIAPYLWILLCCITVIQRVRRR